MGRAITTTPPTATGSPLREFLNVDTGVDLSICELASTVALFRQEQAQQLVRL